MGVKFWVPLGEKQNVKSPGRGTGDCLRVQKGRGGRKGCAVEADVFLLLCRIVCHNSENM